MTCDAVKVCSKEAWKAYEPGTSLDLLEHFCTPEMKTCRNALADRDWKMGCGDRDQECRYTLYCTNI